MNISRHLPCLLLASVLASTSYQLPAGTIAFSTYQDPTWSVIGGGGNFLPVEEITVESLDEAVSRHGTVGILVTVSNAPGSHATIADVPFIYDTTWGDPQSTNPIVPIAGTDNKQGIAYITFQTNDYPTFDQGVGYFPMPFADFGTNLANKDTVTFTLTNISGFKGVSSETNSTPEILPPSSSTVTIRTKMEITSIQLSGNPPSSVKLSIIGIPYQGYWVQYSTNLVDWNRLIYYDGTFTGSNTVTLSPPSNSRGFYRLFLQ